jgi:hypothetical protein
MVSPPLLKIDMVDCWKYRWNLLRLSRSEWSAIVPEFRGRPGNDALVGAISFLDTKKIRDCQVRLVRRVVDHSNCLGTKNCRWFCSSLSQRGTTSCGFTACSSPPLQELARFIRQA